jgi:hypothetical protein
MSSTFWFALRAFGKSAQRPALLGRRSLKFEYRDTPIGYGHFPELPKTSHFEAT